MQGIKTILNRQNSPSALAAWGRWRIAQDHDLRIVARKIEAVYSSLTPITMPSPSLLRPSSN